MSYETEIDGPNGIIIFRGGVRATFDRSILTTDELIIRRGNSADSAVDDVQSGSKKIKLRPKEAYANGKVTVTDPDGNFTASNLWFTWDPDRAKEVTGIGETVEINMGNSHVKADKMYRSEQGYDLTNVSFWTGNWRTPLFKFNAESVFFVPGKQGVAKHLRLSLFGVQLPEIPRYVFSLDPRASGISLPSIGFRQGAGIGTSWTSSFPVSDSATISTSITAFPNVQPTYALSYSKSYVKEKDLGVNQYYISDQFGERSQFSFFGNIYMDSLSSAFDRMKTQKDLFSVNSTFNYETLGRVTDRTTNYSQPIEFGYERGGPLGKFAYLYQLKASRIIEAGDRSATRLGIYGSTFLPLTHHGRLTAGTRIDGAARIDASSSGYIGGETGINYDLSSGLSVSTGAYGYKNFGNPLFLGDNFRSNQGYVMRGDWLGKSSTISLMFRYDPTQGWFDREYRLTQVVGPIEPVLVYRQSPRQYVLGIRFRTNDIANTLRRRNLR
ncbi:MAG: hypothetical protein WCG75_12825, partial [Armatimonadota bacterium]